MKLFYGEINDKIAILSAEESKHAIKVLRLSLGDEIQVTNGLGEMIVGKIIQIGKQVDVSIEKQLAENYIPKQKLHIAIAPTKNINRFEFFLEKATELGVSEITPILTSNSERKIINQEKLEKQIISASKQSLRSTFPKLNPLTKLSDFVLKNKNSKIHVAHCNSEFNRKELHEVDDENPIILIGPEGDFSIQEIQKMIDENLIGVSLGKQRLRTETAGIFVASYFYGKSI
ncbi:MAG: 16S rRNA (uracil(1498)-N(3))-methyltransferase [Flavobacteriales bacterium]|nr:16S rRNA (uracil(1498)-N(3))-methyltransferase [Flavobacteriales bacterium]